MSNNTLYYGEIVARIAGRLYSITNHLEGYQLPDKQNQSVDDIVCDISADAGRVFDRLEDLSGEHFINWPLALEHYCDALRSFVLEKHMPSMADMITLAAKSIEHSKPA